MNRPGLSFFLGLNMTKMMNAPSRRVSSPIKRTFRIFMLPFIGCLLGVISCSSGPTEPDLASRTIEAGDFTVVTRGDVSDGEVTNLLDALAANSPRILGHLQVLTMPHITIRIWAANQSRPWFSAMESSLGTVYEGATGYLWGEREMRLLLNSESSTEVVHEYAHLVSMQVNPTIPNNPRWLWEAIATYEAGQLDHPGSWPPGFLTFPGFTALNRFNSPFPYMWGYLISEAIIDRWGDEAYLSLIENNGRVQEALGISESAFGTYLEEFLRGYP